MTNQRSRDSTDHFESLIDPKNAEELKRTKTEIENNITKILKVIKNENHTKKDGNPKRSKKEAELVGLTEDLSKQYQSLYALYDGVIGRVVSGRKNRTDTVSSPGYDSEDEVYFSSEEVDGNKRRSKEKEQQNVSSAVKEEADTKEVLKAEASSVEAKEYEEQLTSLMKEVNNLSQKKRNLELEVESQENEIKQLTLKKTELEDQVMKLEFLKEKQDVVINLDEKLKDCEEQAKSNIEKLLAQINVLQLEAKTLQKQKDEMEVKVKFDRNEASTQIENMLKQLNILQQKLNSLEAEMGRKGEQISQYMIEIENLKNNLAKTRSTKKTMKEEKEGFLARIKELEQESETQNNIKNELEKQLRDSNYENKQLMNENKSLQDRNNELKAAVTDKGEEIYDFLKQNESNKNGASMETISLKAEINDLRLELDTLYEQKTKLEIQNEQNQKEYSESIVKMEYLNTKLAAQISDQEKTIKDHIATIDRINVEQKQALIASKLELDTLYEQKTKLEIQTERNQKEYSESIAKMENLNTKLAAQISDQEKTIKDHITTIDRINVEKKEALIASRLELDTLNEQKTKLEIQNEQNQKEYSESIVKMEYLNTKLAAQISDQEKTIKDHIATIDRINVEQKQAQIASTLELDTLYEQKTKLEIQTERNQKEYSESIAKMENLNTKLAAQISDQKKTIKDHITTIDRINVEKKEALIASRLELDTLYEQKTKLEIQNERNQKEYSESIAKMENLNTKLAAQISDQEKTIKDHIDTIDRINVEQKQALIAFRLNQRWAERKMEEVAEVFRKKMEDNMRLLHQRIHVAEQLNNENKNSCRLTKIRYEQENKSLREKVASYEEELRRLKEPLPLVVMDLKEDVMNGLDLAAEKVEEQRECVLKSVSKMLCEVEFAKDWAKKRNEEMKKMKELVSEKEERELLLRDKVWNLEAEVSKGGGENLNLRKAVSKLEKKVGKLENNVKEKDEELISLGEKKREAIRQLCIVVEFHRDRCNYLRSLVPNPKVNKRT